MYSAKGTPFAVCPFPTTIYRLSTGDNISSETLNISYGVHLGHFIRRVTPFDKRLVTNEIKNEFCIN